MSKRYPGGFLTGDEPTVNAREAEGIWTLDQQAGYQGQGEWPPSPYQISRSLRFNSADTTYLNRTPASAGNQTKWTWSAWIKRSALSGTTQAFFYSDGTSDTTYFWIGFNGSEQLACGNWSAILLATTQVFRDVSSWYHISVVLDTSQATATDRIKFYVNGTQVTEFATNNLAAQISQNEQCGINNTVPHSLGRDAYTGGRFYLNGYLTEIHFVDGQALTPDDFGRNNPTTGVWEPLPYIGTYGTNGFYLNFSDNSGVTAVTLGADSSGNGNNWTPNNFSVDAGAGNDSMVDVPTPYGVDTGAGGEVRGNYCTLNPLNTLTIGGFPSGATLTNGSLDARSTVAAYRNSTGTIAFPSTGKWYFEAVIISNSSTGNNQSAGIGSITNTSKYFIVDFFALSSSSVRKLVDGTATNLAGSVGNGTVIGVAVDCDNQKAFISLNNTWIDSSNPLTGVNGYAMSSNDSYVPFFSGYNSGVTSFNFGQRPFAYTAPSGFKALCTQNLPEPTVVQGGDYFNTVIYSGTSATQNLTVGFQPDWVWIKKRSDVGNHILTDAVRGNTKQLRSNETSVESTITDMVTAFSSTGVTLGADTNGGVNATGSTYVAWNWNAGGSNATNTDGTITSTVRANPTAGFSIVSWTGTGSAASYGHGLGVAPKLYITKNSSSADWMVKTTAIDGSLDFLYLNLTNAKGDSSVTAPSNTVINLGTGIAAENASEANYITYAFAEIEGYSKIGSYTGNGSTDGPFVYCGFRPAFFLIKQSSASGEQWYLIDDTRNTYNPEDKYLMANLSNEELTYTFGDFLSNGFKLKNTGVGINGSGSTYIFMAFAENPFKYSLAR